MANYKSVKGATEKVSEPKVQTFEKHSPVMPAKKKLKYSK